MERLINAIDNLSQLYEEYILSETDMVNIRPYDEILQDVHSLLEKYRDTGLTPDEVIEYKKFEDGLVLKYNTPLSVAIERIEKYPQLQKEIEQLKDELNHAYDKSNTAVNGYYELKQSYEQLQKENAELKKEVKLWEQGREAIANQAKLVEKISFENSKKYFEEKAKKDQLAELLLLILANF